MHSCSCSLPPTLRCDWGSRKMCGIGSPDVWDKLELGPDTNSVSPCLAGQREGGVGSMRSCSHNLPPTLRCDLGIRKMCGTSPPAVWDKPTLGRILILFRHLGVCKDFSIWMYTGATRVEARSGTILRLSGVLVMYWVLFQMRSV